MSSSKSQAKGVLALLTTALVWGISFVAQSEGMKIGAFTFNGTRTVLAGLVLLPVIWIFDKKKRSGMSEAELADCKEADKKTIKNGMIMGVILFIASNLQQFAFMDSSSGKVAFITTTYMFFVPLIGIPLGKRVSKAVWACVLMGFVGLFFLCMDPNDLTQVRFCDLLALAGAVMFAVHTLAIEKFAADADGIKLAAVQFLVSGAIGEVCMMIFENPSLQSILSGIIPILYAGFIGSGVGYTLQVIGQQHVEATVASLLLSMESVFAVLSGALFLKEMLLTRELIGCTIMFAAIILSQLAGRNH